MALEEIVAGFIKAKPAVTESGAVRTACTIFDELSGCDAAQHEFADVPLRSVLFGWQQAWDADILFGKAQTNSGAAAAKTTTTTKPSIANWFARFMDDV